MLASKLRPTICQSENASSCNKTPIDKIGGGGTRAARRIRIHIQRSLRNMCEATAFRSYERPNSDLKILIVAILSLA